MPKQNERKVIVVVGDRAAGKSKLVQRLVEEPCSFDSYTPTIDECYNVVWKLPDRSYLQVQVIDTAGWNEFPAMQSLFVKMAHLVLLVYDVTSIRWRKTLLSTISEIRSIQADADILAVGNKCDGLTLDNDYSAAKVHTILNHSALVGHVCVSARTELGVEGLKQMILCSESQLTLGHYTSLGYTPKRQKMKKSNGGILMRLAHLLMSKRKRHDAKSNTKLPQDSQQRNITNESTAKQMSTFSPTEQSYDALFTAAQTSPVRGFSRDPRGATAISVGRRGSLDVPVNTGPRFRADRERSQSLASLLEDGYYDMSSTSSLSSGSAEITSMPYQDEGRWTLSVKQQDRRLGRRGSLDPQVGLDKQSDSPGSEYYGTLPYQQYSKLQHNRAHHKQNSDYLRRHTAPLTNECYSNEDFLSNIPSSTKTRDRVMSEGSAHLRKHHPLRREKQYRFASFQE